MRGRASGPRAPRRSPTGLGACACVALLVLACKAPPLVPLPPSDPRPGALLDRFLERASQRESLRGSARLAVDAEAQGVRLRSRQRVVLARPARLRVEVTGLLGNTLAVLTVDDEDYAWFEAQSRHFERGPVHPGLLWNLVRLDLTPDEAVSVILGAPRIPEDHEVLGAWQLGEGATRIALGGPGGPPRQSLDLDVEARLLRFEQWGDDPAAPLWRAGFGDHAEVDGVILAHTVTIETRGGTRASLSLSGVELNPALDPDIFRLDAIAPLAEEAGEGG